MTQISTISEFLLQAGTEYRLFDMGRVIKPMSEQTFLDLENSQFGVPQPRLQHAWFGLIFWNKGLSQQHYVWFLKLPLDEQAKLLAAPRMQFLQLVIEALGQELEGASEKQAELPNNVYIFRPSQQQLADFNSQCKQLLGLDLSQHYQQALAYVKAPNIMDWQHLALQGIADLALQHNNEAVAKPLADNLANVHPQVQSNLLKSCEHYSIEKSLSDAILSLAQSQPENLALQLDCLRALSQAQDESAVFDYIQQLLSEHTNENLLLVISGRHWHRLTNQRLRDAFIQQVATHNLFTPIFSDLVMIPSIREHMLQVLRDPDNSEPVRKAIGELFSQHKR